MSKYCIVISEKKTGHSFYYGNAGYGFDFLPVMPAYVNVPEEYRSTYGSEKSAMDAARRVIPHEALKKHYVYICEYRGGSDAGWYAVVEMMKL